MTNELIEQYFTNLRKFESGEWTSSQWYDYCTMVLGELMNEQLIDSLEVILEQEAFSKYAERHGL